MKKLFLFVSGIASVSRIFSQTISGAPVEDIERLLLQDTNLYQNIAGRFTSGDTTLTTNELKLLYYGSVFQPDFDPKQEERILDAGNALARREKHEDAIRLFNNLLSKHPACLRGWLEKAYTAWLIADSVQAVSAYGKYNRLLQAPLQSGTGESLETAIVVRSLTDEELLLNKLGWISPAPSLVTHNGQRCHIFACVKEDDRNVKTNLYFNVELPFKLGLQRTLKKKN